MCVCVCVCVSQGVCNASQLQSFQQYRLATMAALNASGLYRSRPGYGIWNDACIAHTQVTSFEQMFHPQYHTGSSLSIL